MDAVELQKSVLYGSAAQRSNVRIRCMRQVMEILSGGNFLSATTRGGVGGGGGRGSRAQYTIYGSCALNLTTLLHFPLKLKPSDVDLMFHVPTIEQFDKAVDVVHAFICKDLGPPWTWAVSRTRTSHTSHGGLPRCSIFVMGEKIVDFVHVPRRNFECVQVEYSICNAFGPEWAGDDESACVDVSMRRHRRPVTCISPDSMSHYMKIVSRDVLNWRRLRDCAVLDLLWTYEAAGLIESGHHGQPRWRRAVSPMERVHVEVEMESSPYPTATTATNHEVKPADPPPTMTSVETQTDDGPGPVLADADAERCMMAEEDRLVISERLEALKAALEREIQRCGVLETDNAQLKFGVVNFEEQTRKLEEQTRKLEEQTRKLEEQTRKLEEQNRKLEEQNRKLEAQVQRGSEDLRNVREEVEHMKTVVQIATSEIQAARETLIEPEREDAVQNRTRGALVNFVRLDSEIPEFIKTRFEQLMRMRSCDEKRYIRLSAEDFVVGLLVSAMDDIFKHTVAEGGSLPSKMWFRSVWMNEATPLSPFIRCVKIISHILSEDMRVCISSLETCYSIIKSSGQLSEIKPKKGKKQKNKRK
jgi:hypothetical protein